MHIDVRSYLNIAHHLVEQDETELALKVLECLPGYYRDNVPEEIKKLKSQILKWVTMPHDLLSDIRELPKTKEWSVKFLNGTTRGAVLKQLVSKLNEEGKTPHIVDMGPGDFTFAIGLDEEGFRFTYYPISLNQKALDAVQARLPLKYTVGTPNNKEIPVIYVSFETIEHLPRVEEIRQHYERIATFNKPLYVLLSTPKYCFGDGSPDWEKTGIQHLRSYTPREFIFEALRLFPEYEFEYNDGDVQVVKGKLKNEPGLVEPPSKS